MNLSKFTSEVDSAYFLEILVGNFMEVVVSNRNNPAFEVSEIQTERGGLRDRKETLSERSLAVSNSG